LWLRAIHAQLILKAEKNEVKGQLEAAAANFDATALILSLDKAVALELPDTNE
jgi:hypothetical protein